MITEDKALKMATAHEILSASVGRIRGNTLNEKVEFLRNRYLKTALDCEKEREANLDTSAYRAGFGASHEYAGNLLVDWDESADYLKTEIIGFLRGVSKTEYENGTYYAYGKADAYTYIVCELEKAIEESDV